jgi:hypothetical protein
MHQAIVVFALSIAVCGCDKHGGQLQLEPLARGLAEAWQPVALDMKLDMHPEVHGEQVTMHCVLRNISASEIDVDRESLPWNNADAFSVSAVAADGEVSLQKPVSAHAVIARISAPHAPVPLASRESLEGKIDLGLMRISDIPHNQNLLLLWSYPLLKEWRTEAQYALSGITLLTAMLKGTAPVSTTTELDPSIGGTSVPTQKMMEDLRDAPETLVFDDTVIRLLAFPWSNRMPMAVSRDPNTGMSKPDSRPIHISFRLISEHGTPVPLTLRVQAVWIVQDSQIWNASAIEETVGESNESSRDFLVHDGPQWRSMTPVDVVLTLRDEKGALHWLAVRHQRIAAVE